MRVLYNDIHETVVPIYNIRDTRPDIYRVLDVLPSGHSFWAEAVTYASRSRKQLTLPLLDSKGIRHDCSEIVRLAEHDHPEASFLLLATRPRIPGQSFDFGALLVFEPTWDSRMMGDFRAELAPIVQAPLWDRLLKQDEF